MRFLKFSLGISNNDLFKEIVITLLKGIRKKIKYSKRLVKKCKSHLVFLLHRM